MGSPTEVQLRTILDLTLAGSQLPVKAIESLIAGDERAEDLLLSVVQSRAIRDDSWAPVWALVALGERRSPRALPAILDCIRLGSDLVHEAVEFALLRYGPEVVEPVIRFLEENPGLEGRVHLYAVLGSARTPRAVDWLIARLRLDEECVAPIAWALAESRDPRAFAAIEREARRLGGREPEVGQALEGARTGEDLTNPLHADWRTHWAFEEEDDEDAAGAEEGEPETMRDEDDGGLNLQPRWFDVRCPCCDAQIEYDSVEDEARLVRSPKSRVPSPKSGGSGD